MERSNNLGLLIGAVILALAIMTLGAIGFIQSEKAIKNQAIDGCLNTAQVQSDRNGQTLTVPENYWYTFCMKQKGYVK